MTIATIPSKYHGGKQNPTKVVIHSMGEYIEAGDQEYFAKDFLDLLGYAAHYLICPSGVIIQCIGNDYMGAHAKGHNEGSIGIEILVPGVWEYETFKERIKTPYMTGDQYTAAIELCRTLRTLNFVRHSDIDPSRKVDPGDGLDWQTFLSDIDNG